jgi:hypothetical protein
MTQMPGEKPHHLAADLKNRGSAQPPAGAILRDWIGAGHTATRRLRTADRGCRPGSSTGVKGRLAGAKWLCFLLQNGCEDCYDDEEPAYGW